MTLCRRHFCAALGAVFVSVGCGKNLSVKTVEVALENFSGRDAFDADYPDRLPYASMAVLLPNLKRGLVILGKVDGDELHWITADRGVLVTRFGRLVRSAGFPENVARTEFIDPDFLDPAVPLRDGMTCRRQVDFVPGNYYGAIVNSTLRVAGEHQLIVGKRQMNLRLFEETVSVDSLGWSYTNRFWVDSKRAVWRSEQFLAPGHPPMTIDVMKPYAGVQG
ncbi:YjbF family lipoprotein [Azonexus sp.]|uniref:YjbF family lipoprotein n=1 Tax=Azonexus sp. TaxID=1872668 RepID=UPI0039E48361